MTTAEVLVWSAQTLYFSRFLVQWYSSERAGRSVAPRIFWWISLGAALLLAAGAALDTEWLLVPACCVNAAIYAHNLLRREGRASSLGPLPAAALGAFAAGVLLWFGIRGASSAWTDLPTAILVAAIAGQVIWGTRFPVQWLLSERRGTTHFPVLFWWLSLVGAVFNLIYTIWLGKPMYVAAYVIAWFVPLRNLVLEYRPRSAEPADPSAGEGPST